MNRPILLAVLLPLIAILLVAADPPVPADITQHPSCKYCGMNRQMFAHSRMFIRFADGYYDLRFVDARGATYVVGSDVFGPMGKELAPFEKESDARQFMADHQGKSMVKFGGVSPELLRTLE